MARDKSRAWLDRLLAGEHLTPGDLQVLVEECPEGQFIDYKAGAVLEKRDPAGLVRKYAASFGNADGGVLMIGYDANPKVKQFDGAKAPGGGALAEWASRAMTQVPQLAPRLSMVSVDDKEVLLVSVPRCRSLVPVVEQGELVYYLRHGDQTLRMQPYLIHDIMLGRRAEPELTLRLHGVRLDKRPLGEGPENWHARDVQLMVVVENVGLSTAEDVRVGLVAWSPRTPPQEATATLQQSVNAEQPTVFFDRRPHQPDWMLGHFRLRCFAPRGVATAKLTLDLPPFEQTAPESLHAWPLVIFQALPERRRSVAMDACKRAERRGATRISAALYVLAKNCAPWWYELTLEYDQTVMGWDDSKLLQQLRLEPVTEGRPRVAVDFLPEAWAPPQ